MGESNKLKGKINEVIELIVLLLQALRFKKLNKSFMRDHISDLLSQALNFNTNSPTFNQFKSRFKKLISFIFGYKFNDNLRPENEPLSF